MLTFKQLNRIFENKEQLIWHKQLFTRDKYFTLRPCHATKQPCKNKSNVYLIGNKYFGLLCSKCAQSLRREKSVLKISKNELVKIQFTFKILGD